jgi:putative component of membrane protein insertase Oxa1/YidC/SpoIIIJ protein YidD
MIIKIFFISILIFTVSTLSQSDWVRWEKVEYNYEKQNNFRHRDYSFNTESASGFIAKSAVNTYWYFFSELDGDNCPYRPSCSAFFVQSAKETNIFQGTLMFFDRFTRDYNIYKRDERYPKVKDGHFYDPVSLYTLDEDKIEYIPPSVLIEK